MSWYILAFSITLLCPFLFEGVKQNGKSEGIKSLIAIKNLFLRGRESDIEQLQSILIFPIQLASEVYAIYEVRKETTWYVNASSLGREIHAETNLTNFLDEYEYDFKMAVGDIYATGYTYANYNPFNATPDRDVAKDERILLAFKCYLKWQEDNLDYHVVEKALRLPPFVTMVTLRIHYLQTEQFQWREWMKFFTSETRSRLIELEVLRSIKTFGYAEFGYEAENDCVAGALRLIVTPHLAIVFVISLKEGDRTCRAPETLLRILEDINFETIDFKPQRLFVSIPIIKTAGVVYPAKHLNRLGLYFDRPNMGSISDRFLSMGLVFDPEVRPNLSISKDVPKDIKRFQVERPFLVAVIQAGNKLPLVLGLIQRPIASINFRDKSTSL